MAVRLIAIDLDGTLLHDDMTISDYSRQVIKKAQSQGYEIVVATGRMWDSAKAKADTLQLGNVPLICYTGAWIMMSETGEPVRQEGLSPDLASAILLESKKRGWNATSFMDDVIYMDKPNGTEKKYQKYRSKKPVYLGENFYHPEKLVTRIVFADPSLEKRMAIRQVVEDKFSGLVDVVFPGDDFVDVHKKESIKEQPCASSVTRKVSLPMKSWHLEIQKTMCPSFGWPAFPMPSAMLMK